MVTKLTSRVSIGTLLLLCAILTAPCFYSSAANAAGWVDVSSGVSVSPSTVTIGGDFTISFSLREYNGGSKTFEYVEVWIQDGDGNDLFQVDGGRWTNQSFSASQSRSYSVTTYLDPERRAAGSYRAIIRGKVAGDSPFNFGVVPGSSAVNPKTFWANAAGWVDVSSGVSVSPSTVTIGGDFTISFSLREYNGGSKTFEYVEVWIQDGDGNDLFQVDGGRWTNQSFSASQSRSYSVTTYLDPERRAAGSYRAIIRGKVAGDSPFNFGVVPGSSAVNPKTFWANAAGWVDVSSGVSVSPSTVTIGGDFTISFSLREYNGGSKTFEYVEVWIQDGDGNDLFQVDGGRWTNQSFSASQSRSYSVTTYLDPERRAAGSYRAIIRGKVAGDSPFNFGVVPGSSAVNPKTFWANAAGWVDVSSGVSVSPSTVTIGGDFTISFSLREYNGGSKTFEYVEVWIQDGDGNDLFQVDGGRWTNQSFSASQSRSYSVTTYLDPERRAAGSYRAIIRGKVAGDSPFNFGVVPGSSAVNPKTFWANGNHIWGVLIGPFYATAQTECYKNTEPEIQNIISLYQCLVANQNRYDGANLYAITQNSTLQITKKDDLLRFIEYVASLCKSGDLFVFSFAGHGVVDSIYTDGSETSDEGQGQIAASELYESLRKSDFAARKVKLHIFLEACHSGSFIDDLKKLGGDVYIFTSAKKDELAYRGCMNTKWISLFTWAYYYSFIKFFGLSGCQDLIGSDAFDCDIADGNVSQGQREDWLNEAYAGSTPERKIDGALVRAEQLFRDSVIRISDQYCSASFMTPDMWQPDNYIPRKGVIPSIPLLLLEVK